MGGEDKVPVNMIPHLVMGLGKRQCTVLVGRYKWIFLCGLFTLVLYAGYSGSEKGQLDKKGSHGNGIAHDGRKAKEYVDFDYNLFDKKSKKVFEVKDAESPRNVKESVHKFLDKNKLKNNDSIDSSKQVLLFPPNDDNEEVPKHDFKSPPKGAIRPTRRTQNSLNGVQMFNPGEIEWAAVGSLDLFPPLASRGQHDEFAADDAKIVPGLGDGGEPVILDGAEADLAAEIMRTEAFNLVVSDKISYTREVPDTKDARCNAVYYDEKLPSTSIIIIFTNEAWSPLIRTIHSVLNKSPAKLLKEIILVDDFSDKKHLKGKLERYIQKKFPSKVKLMRLKKREGLIRARIEGAKAATGDVMLYLDSHCECTTGWLEPLLQRIKENPMAFVVPIIDVIDDKTLEYYHGNGNYFQVGGFTWSGHFTWVDIPQVEIARRGSPIAPTRSPTMAGGLFAVDRETFWKMGSYDPEMDVWGGENLEMSFRIWQCGGVLETIPCSRVGHIFRSFHPYSFPGNKDTHGINTARTVEVWMDEYKRLFYMNRPDLLKADIGNTDARLEFKKEHQCKPFKWFLDNIYPDKFILDDPAHVFAYGRLRNAEFNSCLDNLQNDDKDSFELGQYVCHNFMASAQFFSFSRNYELRREDSCAEVMAPFPDTVEKVNMVPCKGQGEEQEWAHTKEGKMIHKNTRKCLDAGRGNSMDLLYVAPCQNKPSQKWFFDHYIN